MTCAQSLYQSQLVLVIITWWQLLGKPKFHKLDQRSLKKKKKFNKVQWDRVCLINNVVKTLELFTEMFLDLADKHASIRKFTVRKRKAPWIDEQLKTMMTQRDKMKILATIFGNTNDWKAYCSLRDQVTNANRKKKSKYYPNKFNSIKHDGKKLWKTLNDSLNRAGDNTHSFIVRWHIYYKTSKL